MKKLSILMLFISITSFSIGQEVPCPTVTNQAFTVSINNNNGTCTRAFKLHIRNDVAQANPKAVSVEILLSSTDNVILKQCFIASTASGGADYETTKFTYPCSSNIGYRITRYTASNGQCQGGTCQETVLPVMFASFKANRNKFNNVLITWQTATEENNLGFYIERSTGNNTWEQIAFIPSKGLSGNSSKLLNYEYNDKNIISGLIQYRIRQVNLDLQSKLTEIISLNGKKSANIVLIYPNPSSGSTTVYFSDLLNKDISLVDISSRIILVRNNFNDSKLNFDNLKPGVYFLNVTQNITGNKTVKKIIVL